MIEDRELRDLFKVECEEHLQKLSDGFLRLEKDPKESSMLEEVFREAHSLKGAARMVGVFDVETIAHRFEDILGAAKAGKSILTSEVVDRLYKGLDSIQRFVKEAVTGEKANINVSDVMGQISGEAKSPEPGVRGSEIKAESRIQEPGAGIEKTETKIPDSKKASPSEFRIETVRVDTKILDMLMTQAGELTVTKTNISRRVSEIEEIAEIAASSAQNEELNSKLQNLKSAIGADSARLDFIAGRIEQGISHIRLVPLSTIFNLYPRMVRDISRGQGKDVNLVIEGGEIAADKRIIEEMKDPVMHLIRNSIDHGIEGSDDRKRLGKPVSGTINIRAFQAADSILIEVSDDGKGFDIEAIKRTAVRRRVCTEEEIAAMTRQQIEALVFTPGFSTSPLVTDVSGRGVGLDVVRQNVERLKGTVSFETFPGAGCRFALKLPLTLATVRVLIVQVDGRHYAIPVEYLETSRFVYNEEIFTVAGRKTVSHDGQPVSVARLSDILDSGSQKSKIQSASGGPKSKIEKSPCIILSINKEKAGLLVDGLIDEQEVILKPHSAILKRVRNVSGATILATGEVCMVLNPSDLLKSTRKAETPAVPEKQIVEAARKKSVLLAEDSITTRTQEKRILEGAGYAVVTAVDGLDALNKLNSRPFDAVVSDILMPNMDGLTLTEKIRQDKKFKELPVILVTTLASDEDRKKGLEAGADAYITKPTFDQKMLLEILRRLI